MNGRVLTRFEVTSSPRTREAACNMDVSHALVCHILHEEWMHPFQVQKFQFLPTEGHPCRADFVHWMCGKKLNDPCFLDLLQAVTLSIQRDMWFMNGLVQPHFFHDSP